MKLSVAISVIKDLKVNQPGKITLQKVISSAMCALKASQVKVIMANI